MTSRLLRAAAPLAALVYPALVACGPALWPPLLATALLAPGIAVWASLRLAEVEARAARAIALAAIGAPALFSLLGGLLDFQHAIPLTSVRVWIPLWLVLAAVAVRKARTPRNTAHLARTSTSPRSSRLAIAHGIAALPLIAFAMAHLVNHLCGLAGGAAHLAVMRALRYVYRDRYVEPVLLASIAVVGISGLTLVARRLARCTTPIETLQGAAGAYLSLFFASHLTAVLRARGRGIDTDWHWLTGSDLLHDPWNARLVPYYALAVIALAVHLACGLRAVAIGHGASVRGWNWVVAAAVGLAAVASTSIVWALAA